jgi:hypothetical protein
MLSSDTCGVQHGLEFFEEFFNELILVFVLFLTISAVDPINNGTNTDATGIRHSVIDDIPTPISAVMKDGIPPKNALPAFSLLHVEYCVKKLRITVILYATTGIPIHNINLNVEGFIASLKLNKSTITIMIIKPPIPPDNSALPLTLEFVAFVASGLDITNYMSIFLEGQIN